MELSFFASPSDIKGLFEEIESEYDFKYIPCGKLWSRFSIQHSIHAVTAPDGRTCCISPRIYPHRHEITFQMLNNTSPDCQFRIAENDNVIEIWTHITCAYLDEG